MISTTFHGTYTGIITEQCVTGAAFRADAACYGVSLAIFYFGDACIVSCNGVVCVTYLTRICQLVRTRCAVGVCLAQWLLRNALTYINARSSLYCKSSPFLFNEPNCTTKAAANVIVTFDTRFITFFACQFSVLFVVENRTGSTIFTVVFHSTILSYLFIAN